MNIKRRFMHRTIAHGWSRRKIGWSGYLYFGRCRVEIAPDQRPNQNNIQRFGIMPDQISGKAFLMRARYTVPKRREMTT